MLHSQVFHQILYFPWEKNLKKYNKYINTHTHTYEEKCDMSENNIISVELVLGTPGNSTSSFQCGACPGCLIPHLTDCHLPQGAGNGEPMPTRAPLGMDGGGSIGNTSSFESNSLTWFFYLKEFGM
jgi:hypothetical protein